MKSKEHGLNDVAFTIDQNRCISVITHKGNQYQEVDSQTDMWEFSWLKSDGKEEESLFALKTRHVLPMWIRC